MAFKQKKTTPYTLNPTPYTLDPTPYTLHPKPQTPNPKSETPATKPRTLACIPIPQTLDPKPETRNPKPQGRSPKMWRLDANSQRYVSGSVSLPPLYLEMFCIQAYLRLCLLLWDHKACVGGGLFPRNG